MRTRISYCIAAVTAAITLAGLAATGAEPARGAAITGSTIVINPGHNGGNAGATRTINRLVPIGQGQTKACDTTGTATSAGYSEAAFNWDVALRTRRLLRSRGATVLLTRQDNRSVGPCIDERARIANRARADLVVSIHADGGPASGYGFHVIEPALITGLTDDIFGASHRLAISLRGAFARATGEPYATYVGRNGLSRRGDLGGLRLSNVPAVFIETGNMRSPRDAARMKRPSYRQLAARGIATGIERFVASG